MIVYYLSTCTTCQRILNEVKPDNEATFIDVKSEPINEGQLAELYQHTKSYEALFNKRAQLYRQRGLNQQKLEDIDFKKLILEHYSFLKRPIFLDHGHLFVGNAKSTIEALKNYLHDQ